MNLIIMINDSLFVTFALAFHHLTFLYEGDKMDHMCVYFSGHVNATKYLYLDNLMLFSLHKAICV